MSINNFNVQPYCSPFAPTAIVTQLRRPTNVLGKGYDLSDNAENIICFDRFTKIASKR